ncbi:MFS transporter [Xylanimonas ulmi]|uniref:MHS family metabolite:H+ symporter-like MFS transporter n=1 Tax=Xylanimonas ulmi TaxID=228973 RepID=A0A4Q7M8L8_9MICO|nr:MFS transporter [Xylanibacterium ulmi]RZS62509.1 MHS family metabolite:H+ symporter-like MFS transporter [Xylanibacterium ulmi]
MTSPLTGSAQADPRGSDDPEYAENLRRATLASSVGSALEYYDFAIYGLAAALIFGNLFFPALPDGLRLVASLATFGVGFLARPVGGLFFGVLGDRLGRKWVLMITIALMGVSTTMVGLLPTGEQIGVWAPVLLVILRLAQGFGAGAEQAGSTTLMAEYAPVQRRGFFAALPFIGIFSGTLLASGVFALVTLAPDDVLEAWLWRVPFLASAILIAVAVWIRVKLRESPTFIHLEEQEQVAEHPLRDLMTHSRRNVLIGIGLRMAENGGSYIFQTLAVSFAVTAGVTKSWGSLAVAISSVIGMITVPLAGKASDKYGRLPVYRAGAVVLLALAVPGWWLLSLGTAWGTTIVITIGISFGVCIMLGSQCALMPELFGNRRRYIGVASAREFSAVIAGGLAPVLGAWMLTATGNAWWPIAAYVLVLAGITFATTFVTPETVARDLTLTADAALGDPVGGAAEASQPARQPAGVA